ncbi:MAG: FAD-dependent oxidoreductase [bacterium]|nr:FAD-dependent oxidoreductase [bacterium]
MKTYLLPLVALLFFVNCNNQPAIQTEIAIVGGGASGVTAALQAARMGQKVTIFEPTEWLGGMLTSAGVSAIDGNHNLPSGIWGEFREHLYDHYGGPEAVFTGWVSRTQFEPSFGNEVFQKMVAAEENITVEYGWYIESVDLQNNKVVGATFTDRKGGTLSVSADVFIDGTEYGDLLARAGADYSINMETYDETKEEAAPRKPLPYVQDLTYVAILEDIGTEGPIIEKPASYDPAEFDCMCKQVCSENIEDLIDCDYMLDYGRLPNDKFMINWPTKGNDFYAEILEQSYDERDSILAYAKEFTKSWIYFMQTEGGYTNLQLAADEFPSEDGYPLIPYIRESRRLVGVDRLFLYDIQDPYAMPERPLYKTGIAVGDYPVDHHRKKNPVPNQFDFPKIPSYSVPYGSLIPQEIDGLIVADKSISVSNLANGTTRLQPVVLQLGQAAGAAAALAVQNRIEPRNVDVRTLQQELLDADMFLMPYMDVQPDHPAFESVQRVGLAGVMRGEGIPYLWANETRIYPDSVVQRENLNDILQRLELPDFNRNELTQQSVLGFLVDQSPSFTSVEDLENETWFSANKEAMNFAGDRSPITRIQLAWLIDAIFDPFTADQVQIGFENPMLD